MILYDGVKSHDFLVFGYKSYHTLLPKLCDHSRPSVSSLKTEINARKALISESYIKVRHSYDNQFPALSKELAGNCKRMGLRYRRFGDFEPSTLLGGQVLDGIRKGFALSDYTPGACIRLKKELNENFGHE